VAPFLSNCHALSHIGDFIAGFDAESAKLGAELIGA